MLVGKSVDCILIDEESAKNLDITEVYNLDKFPIERAVGLYVYLRDERDCPFARGNWMIDIVFDDGEIQCIKLPKEITEEQVNKWLQPLIDLKKAKSQ